MTPTAVSLHLCTFLTLTVQQHNSQSLLMHAWTPGAQHCNCRCLSLMSVIAVGNQIDCTHRPAKCLYSHIQQTSARVPKCYQSTERRNTRDIMNTSKSPSSGRDPWGKDRRNCNAERGRTKWQPILRHGNAADSGSSLDGHRQLS